MPGVCFIVSSRGRGKEKWLLVEIYLLNCIKREENAEHDLYFYFFGKYPRKETQKLK